MSFRTFEVNTPFGEWRDDNVTKIRSRSHTSDRRSKFKKYALGEGKNLSLHTKLVSGSTASFHPSIHKTQTTLSHEYPFVI
jgi:hypothetical protein